MKLLLAGYGGKNAATIGVYNTETHRMEWSGNQPECSFACRHGKLLFGISEQEPESSVYLFVRAGDGYRLCDQRKITGGLLCHIAYVPQHHLLTGACYGDGVIFSLKVEKERFAGQPAYIRQGGRAHCTVPAGPDLLYTANIAQDKLYRYRISAEGLAADGALSLPKGSGPRHILSDGQELFIITEYSNEILWLHKEKLRQRISTLPPGYQGISCASGLCMSQDKRFLYAANRGADSIAIFKASSEKGLESVGWQACGSFPRHIALVDGGRYLACANQKADTVTLMQRENASGRLSEEVLEIPFQAPSYIE